MKRIMRFDYFHSPFDAPSAQRPSRPPERAPYCITVATDSLAIARAAFAKLESGAAPVPHQ